MKIFLASWLANAITLYIIARLFPDKILIANLTAPNTFITQQGLITVLIGALIIGFCNSVIRPILSTLAKPITCLTLGLFSFVVTGLVFYLAVKLTPGMSVASFWWAIIGGVLFGIINSVISGLLGVSKDKDKE